MKKRVIQTEKAPKALGPYSQAIQAGSFLFISGQLPIDPATGELVKGDIQEQTRQVFENMKQILEAQSLTLKDVVKTTLFLKDMANFAKVNEIYAACFATEPPARAAVQVARLPKDAEVEIEAIALFH